MPGHSVDRRDVKNPALFDKYKCPHCSRLLKSAVQPQCGHWLCESCMKELLVSVTPKCPRPDCEESLKSPDDDGAEAEYFPDRFVRREIDGIVVYCINRQKGCEWEGRLVKREDHQRACDYASRMCPYCRKDMSSEEVDTHVQTCPQALVKCPLAHLGCPCKDVMLRQDLEKHVQKEQAKHLEIIASELQKLSPFAGVNPKLIVPTKDELDHDSNATGQDLIPRTSDLTVESDYAGAKVRAKGDQRLKQQFEAVVRTPRVEPDDGYNSTYGQSLEQALNASTLTDISTKIQSKVDAELRQKDEEIASLRNQMSKMEKSMRSKHAEFEDRDFRLSLIENSNYDGSMIWKIPQFSQRMSDAQTGKYTSIFSLPFYTGRYGYKMCLRLYILGDGIGKNTHMSLFFVVMKGEFDNILPWPFTHKVTFKLINQTGGSHITDTFQPDPMSSSFRKPKSDMNIASGCPRFVSHAELKNGGFVVDDTVFIKCSVDSLTVKHP